MSGCRKLVLFVGLLSATFAIQSATSDLKQELQGLWGAEKIFASGGGHTLTVDMSGEEPIAYVLGQTVQVEARTSGELAFQLPSRLGRFEGHLNPKTDVIEGHWISSPREVLYSHYASPVSLTKTDAATYGGLVHPLPESFSVYFLIELTDTGDLTVLFRNPDRNQGVFSRIASVQIDERILQFQSPAGEEVLRGEYLSSSETIVLDIPFRGGIYELTKRSRNDAQGYYPAPQKSSAA